MRVRQPPGKRISSILDQGQFRIDGSLATAFFERIDFSAKLGDFRVYLLNLFPVLFFLNIRGFFLAASNFLESPSIFFFSSRSGAGGLTARGTP